MKATTVSPPAVVSTGPVARPSPVRPGGGHRFAVGRLAAVLAAQAAARRLECLDEIDPVAAAIDEGRAVADWLHSHAPAGLEGR